MSAIIDLKAEQRAPALAAADERMSQAKARFSLAALACMRGALDAAYQVQQALAEVDAARHLLRTLSDAQLEQQPGAHKSIAPRPRVSRGRERGRADG